MNKFKRLIRITAFILIGVLAIEISFTNESFAAYASNMLTAEVDASGEAASGEATSGDAQPQQPITYKINYELNGGVNAEDNPASYSEEQKELELMDAVKEGYTFAGWYLDAAYKEKIEKIDCSLKMDITLYAKYELLYYAIDFTLYGGQIVGEYNSTYSCESDTYVLPIPVRQGYEFAGWYENSSFAGQVWTQIPYNSSGVKEFYAKWNLIQYSINYHLNGGKNSSLNPVSYTYLSNHQKLFSPTKKGYTFGGWYTNPQLTEKITQIPSASTGTYELYGKWNKVSTKKVSKVTLKKKGKYLAISYKKVTGAKGYEITYYQKGNAKKKTTISLSKLKYTLLKCKSKKTYVVKVRAYKYDSENQRIYGKYSKTCKCKMS